MKTTDGWMSTSRLPERTPHYTYHHLGESPSPLRPTRPIPSTPPVPERPITTHPRPPHTLKKKHTHDRSTHTQKKRSFEWEISSGLRSVCRDTSGSPDSSFSMRTHGLVRGRVRRAATTMSDDSMRVVDKTRADAVARRHTATRDERARVRIRRIESHPSNARAHAHDASEPAADRINQTETPDRVARRRCRR